MADVYQIKQCAPVWVVIVGASTKLSSNGYKIFKLGKTLQIWGAQSSQCFVDNFHNCIRKYFCKILREEMITKNIKYIITIIVSVQYVPTK